MKKILALLMIIACLASTSAMARTLTASVNRPEIPQGEVVVLTLEYLGVHTDKTPDLSVLKKDFNIFSMEQEFQNIYDNGKTYQLQKWNIGLMPKGVGKILIPAVSLDGNRSQALEINVIPAGDASAIKAGEENMPKYAISAEIDNTSPYVQQEINMTVSIFDAGGLQGSAPYFDSEAQNDWNILGLGEPTLESKVINGQSVRVIKFKYALFPQKSGTLKLPQARFDGYYLTGRRRSNPLQQLIDSQFGDIGLSISDMSATRNPVVLTTQEQNITVKPAAANTQWWIPAEKLEIYSQWQPSPPVFKVGEAISRNISIKAVGVADKQLPTLSFDSSESIKQYPEKPVSENRIENGKVASVKNIKNVYIPSKAGKALIPEVKIDWFNVKTGKTETARLPATEINVMPGSTVSTAADTPAIPASEKLLPESKKDAIFASQPLQEANATEKEQTMNVYLWSLLSFFCGIFISYLLFSSSRKDKKSVPASSNNYFAEVVKYAKQKDLRALRDSLIFWARQKYHDDSITNLNDISSYNNDASFHQALANLSSLMYAPQKTEWNADEFIAVFRLTNKFTDKNKPEDKPLPELYK